MTRPRLVASDLDGTLVGPDGTVSARTVRALRRVEDAGVPFVMVTGRPPRWMGPLAEQTGHRGVAVCANGALVYDLHTETVLHSHLITADVVAEVVTALRAALPGVSFAVERPDLVFGHEPSYVPRYPNGDGVRVAELTELMTDGVVKLLVRHEEMGPDELLLAARAAVGDRATLTHSSSDGLLEISAAGISKASGLAALAAGHGVHARDAVAFGDMPNDLPMLAWAGRSFAMANAHPDVLAAAGQIAPSNAEDGVAQVLERWF